MPLFRKKPVVIEAKQLTEEACWKQWEERVPFWPDEPLHISGSWHPEGRKVYYAYICIDTPEGVIKAGLGDWIIKGVKGEFYHCKPEIFAATYESTEQESQ